MVNRPNHIRGPNPLTLPQICNLSIGLFGVQVVWGLQNVNTSRIFQTLGADVSDLALLWIAAPITGLIVQPLVGHFSDHLDGRWGRRSPFIVIGGVLTAISLLLMGHAPSLTAAVLGLWLLTISVNILMQPLRALSADRLPSDQRMTGFALQVCFIGAGAIFASALPWILANAFDVAGVDAKDGLPQSIRLAFALGALAMTMTVGWTVFRVRERHHVLEDASTIRRATRLAGTWRAHGLWVISGLAIAVTVAGLDLPHEGYLLAGLPAAYGAIRALRAWRMQRDTTSRGLFEIIDDIADMPLALRRLAITQFLTWFGLFVMWVYSIPAIAFRHFGTSDVRSIAYAQAGDWVGLLAAMYDGVAVITALALPGLTRRIGLRPCYAICLAMGAAGLAAMLVIEDPAHLWISAVGIGIAWAAVLAAPYVIVANSVVPAKTGVYLGIHNIFLVLPQLVGAACLGKLMDVFFEDRPDVMLAIAAAAFACAAASTGLIPSQASPGRESQ